MCSSPLPVILVLAEHQGKYHRSTGAGSIEQRVTVIITALGSGQGRGFQVSVLVLAFCVAWSIVRPFLGHLVN